MTIIILSALGDMIIQETFITPTGIFLVSMSILYLVTAILHPQEFSMIIYGLMYFICIPSGYLLLTIYSLVNMHIVSWGTRESNREKEEGKAVGVLCDRNCKLCCWDLKIQVTQETENLILQQIQNAVGPSAQGQSTNAQEHKEKVHGQLLQAMESHQQISPAEHSLRRKATVLQNKPQEEDDASEIRWGFRHQSKKKKDENLNISWCDILTNTTNMSKFMLYSMKGIQIVETYYGIHINIAQSSQYGLHKTSY